MQPRNTQQTNAPDLTYAHSGRTPPRRSKKRRRTQPVPTSAQAPHPHLEASAQELLWVWASSEA